MVAARDPSGASASQAGRKPRRMVGEERVVGEAQAESTLGAAHRREAGRAEQLFGSGNVVLLRATCRVILGAADSRLGEGAGVSS